MVSFLMADSATTLAGLAVLAVAELMIRSIVRDQKAGKQSCGGGCANCPSCAACHGQRKQ